MALFDETNTVTNSRFAPSLFQTGTTGGSSIQTSQLGPDRFKAGVFLPQDIQALRAENLGGIRSLLESIRGSGGSILNARLRPLQDQISAQGGLLRRGLARRNVTGTLANNEMTNFSNKAGLALGDARAMATDDLIRTESMLNDKIGGVANDVLDQELRSLGISQNAITSIINSMSATSSQKTTSNDPLTSVNGISKLLEILGSI